MIKHVLLFGCLAISSCYIAPIEYMTITAIPACIAVEDQGPQTLVVFGIDNTIAENSDAPLGTDQWFYACIGQYMNHGYDYNTSMRRMNKDLIQMQLRLPLCLIEQEFLEVLEQLKSMGVRVIALTSRPVDILDRTVIQLKQIGVEFNDFADVVIEGQRQDHYRMKNGIIAAGRLGNKKGEILFDVLNSLNYQPSSIFYIDDKATDVKNVVEESNKRGIKVAGIRYKRLDEKVKRYHRTLITNSKFICKKESQ